MIPPAGRALLYRQGDQTDASPYPCTKRLLVQGYGLNLRRYSLV